MWQLAEKYSWADKEPDFVCTIAVVTGSSPRDLVCIYGGNPDEAAPLTFTGAWPSQADFGTHFRVQVFTEDTFTVAIEPNGWTGDVPEIARRASAHGHFVSAYWSMSGVSRITEATAGTVTAHFDPFAVGYPGGMGDLQPDWVEDASFDLARPNASCLAAVELRTGLVVKAEWFGRELPTYRIPDPDAMLKDVENAREP